MGRRVTYVSYILRLPGPGRLGSFARLVRLARLASDRLGLKARGRGGGVNGSSGLVRILLPRTFCGGYRRVYTTQTRARIEGSEDASARGRHAPCMLRPAGNSHPPAGLLQTGSAHADVRSGLLDGQVEQCLRKTKRKWGATGEVEGSQVFFRAEIPLEGGVGGWGGRSPRAAGK